MPLDARARRRLVQIGRGLLGATVAGCCLVFVAVYTLSWQLSLILAVFFAYVGAELARVDGIPPLLVGGLFLAVEVATAYAVAAILWG